MIKINTKIQYAIIVTILLTMLMFLIFININVHDIHQEISSDDTEIEETVAVVHRAHFETVEMSSLKSDVVISSENKSYIHNNQYEVYWFDAPVNIYEQNGTEKNKIGYCEVETSDETLQPDNILCTNNIEIIV